MLPVAFDDEQSPLSDPAGMTNVVSCEGVLRTPSKRDCFHFSIGDALRANAFHVLESTWAGTPASIGDRSVV